MAGTTRARTALSTGVLTDLPLLVTVLAGAVTVSAVVAHRVAAVAIVVAAGMHLASRRGPVLRTRCRGVRATARTVTAWCVLLGFVAMTATGVLRLMGVPREDAWHGGASWLLLAAVVAHAVAVWPRLRARRRRSRRPPGEGGT